MYASFDFVRRIVAETSTSFQSVPVVLFPLAGSAIDLWFVTGQYYDGGTVAITDYLSCSRASIGYAKTSSGSLTQFASNVLRITDLGLLVEDAKINYQIQSQQFTDLQYNPTNTTLTDNAAVAPDGTSTAASAVPTTTSNVNHYFSQNAVTGLTAGVPYTVSIYAKANGYNWIQLDLVDPGVDDHRASFNVSAGTIGSVNAGVTASIEAMADGWFRCSATRTNSVGQTSMAFGVFFNDADTSGNGNLFTGDGLSGFLIWGAQMEQGSFASSYIPTTTTSAARAADVLTTTGNLQTDIAAATASIVARINNGLIAGIAANIVDSNGTNLLGFDAANHGLTSITATLATANTANRVSTDKVGTAWDATGRSLVLNGGTVATDATAQTPSATLHVGSNASSNFIFAYLERLTIWTSKLGSSTLQGFTS